MRPSIIVEFGANNGDSSLNFLKALDDNAKLYSYDINPIVMAHDDTRFTFYKKPHSDFIETDIGGINKRIDLALFDYSDFKEMSKGFIKIVSYMSPNGIIIVHNTGLHYKEQVKCSCDFEKYCGGAHQNETRLFVNWILDNYPEWQTMQIHSYKTWRHGLTLLQKKFKLGVDLKDVNECKTG